ncbi:MAG: methyl-accepting chemotaxis protein [Nostoc sp. LLA-1]|nr:methyl-accepting chemotaxis protein [Cyanocohniella sp. LLY]
MFNKTDTAKSSNTQKQTNFFSFTKITDQQVALPRQNHPATNNHADKNQVVGYLHRLSLSKKAMIVAIAIGTLPTLVMGAIAYKLAHKSITQQIAQSQTAAVTNLSDQVNRFMLGKYEDIQIISSLPFLTNTRVSRNTTAAEKQLVLNRFVEPYKTYSSIAVFDIEGNLIVQSVGKPLDHGKDRNYFWETLKKDTPFISKLEKSVIEIAAPVKNDVSGETIAVVRASIPMKSLGDTLKNYTVNGRKYYLLDTSGKVFLTPQTELLSTEYPGLAQLLKANKVDSFTAVNYQQRELVSYIPPGRLDGFPGLNWQVLLTTDTATAFAPQRKLLQTIAIGTLLTAVITAAIAVWLAKCTTQPILNAATALSKINQGELDTRLATATTDGLGQMNADINQVASQLQVLHKEQEVIHQARHNWELNSDQTLQLQLLELLNQVEGAARGDLTVRADVTAGEIGTVADFFNSIVENLRDIVTQVKQAATQVNGAIGSNEGAIRQLAEEALTQAAEINRTLDAVDQMTSSMKSVAENAQQAAVVANHAAQTATKSGQAMDLTVQNILCLRETVGDTAKKVKRLGESSQQISRVVSLINQIATQTNLLAINAGIEAARAGEEGQGFAVVAEEVGELAVRSAAATQEIEQIVENIQRETSEVVQAMEIGTTQVVQGTQIVEEAKHSLGEILDVSRQIDSLVQSISTATASQLQTSQSVSQLMQNIAAISQRTRDSSRSVSESLHQTVEISQQLQETVETFKVN